MYLIRLTKGPSYNWDLVVIAVINVFSSLYTLPWLHVALPHAPMHVKCLAEFEEEPSGTTQKYGQIFQEIFMFLKIYFLIVFNFESAESFVLEKRG